MFPFMDLIKEYTGSLAYNTEITTENPRIHSEYDKLRARRNSILEHLSRSVFDGVNYFNHFLLFVSFWSPWKHQKTSGFLIFQGDHKEKLWRKGLKQSDLCFRY